jgi:hypothetical protein
VIEPDPTDIPLRISHCQRITACLHSDWYDKVDSVRPCFRFEMRDSQAAWVALKSDQT